MSIDPTNNPNNLPVEPVLATPAVSGEPIAERFVQKELADARRTLRTTQIGATIGAIAIIGYMSFIAANLNRTLEPQRAAEVATGLIVEQVDSHGPEIASQIRQQAPKVIEQLPDMAIKQIPQYRTNLENQVESDMTRYFSSSSTELGKTFDELIDANKDSIGQMLKDGKDPEATKAVGAAMSAELSKYVEKTSLNGETLGTKLDEAYNSLALVEKRMAKLSANQNLTPQEKKARRAIGLLTTSVSNAQNGTAKMKTI